MASEGVKLRTGQWFPEENGSERLVLQQNKVQSTGV